VSFRDNFANTANNLAVVARRLGRLSEALELCGHAIGIREALVKQNPKTPGYRAGLAENVLNRGLTRRALGDLAGAMADGRRAILLFSALKTRSGELWFLTACGHSALAGLAGRAGSGVPSAERASQADAAIAFLQKAAGLGYRSPDAYRTEDALDPIRSRDEFRLLMLDLSFPTNAFASSE
jgi:eukaryotic-like serine/threonine-protein kinase